MPAIFVMKQSLLLRVHAEELCGRIRCRERELFERAVTDKVSPVDPRAKGQIRPGLDGVRASSQCLEGKLEMTAGLHQVCDQHRQRRGRSHNKSVERLRSQNDGGAPGSNRI
jgi:hypothetical protein